MSRQEDCRNQGKYSPSLTRKAATRFLGSAPARTPITQGLLVLTLSGQHSVGPGEQRQAHTVAPFHHLMHGWWHLCRPPQCCSGL